MNDLCVYTIRLRGQISENEINALVPLRLAGAGPVETCATSFSLCTDQSGLIGLTRSLHGLGFVILAVSREEMTASSETVNQ
jgi:hypothetical protein